MGHPSATVGRRQLRYMALVDRSRDDSVLSFLGDITVSQWLLLLWPVAIHFMYRRRGFDAAANIDGSALAQITITALCGLYAVHRLVSLGPAISRQFQRTPLLWLLLYGVLAALSMTWSGLPDLTLFRAGQVLVFLVLAADAFAGVRTVEQLARLQLCYAILLVVFWQFPSLLGNFGLRALHSSQIPGAVVGVVFTGWLLRGWQWRVAYALVVLMVLLGTSTATYVSLIVGVTVLLLTLRGMFAEAALAFALAATLVFAFPQEAKNTVFYGKTDTNIRTATGRLPTWEWLVDRQMRAHPYFGFGFGYGEVQARLYNTSGLRMQHMHSSVMSALVNLGMAGLVMLSLFWLSAWRQLLRIRNPRYRAISCGAVAAVCVNSLAIDSVTSPYGFGWIGHILIYGLAVLPLACYERSGSGQSRITSGLGSNHVFGSRRLGS